MLSVKVMIVVIKFVESGLTGRPLMKARSPAGIEEAACCRAPKLVRPAKSLNLVGLIEDRSCRTPKVGTESCTTGSWKRKLGTTPLRMPRMPLVIPPSPFPPGMAMFFAIEPTREARSGETPIVLVSICTLLASEIQTWNTASLETANAYAREALRQGRQGAELAPSKLWNVAPVELGKVPLHKGRDGQRLGEERHGIFLRRGECTLAHILYGQEK